MFGRKDPGKPVGRINSLIGAGTRVEGNIRFAGGLRIDGEVVGDVESVEGAVESTLVVSENSRIEGNVKVAHLVSNGTIVGRVTVSDSLEMQPRAKIIGDIEYAVIELHQGAVIEGSLLHSVGKSSELMVTAPN